MSSGSADGGPDRPRFVVALCGVAALAIAVELAAVAGAPRARLSVPILGMSVSGSAAIIVLLTHAALQLGIGVGLWRLHAWGRSAAMGYLAFLLASFLLWGLGGAGAREAVYVLAFQVCGLPFLTFSFMYLYRGERYFSSSGDRLPRSSG